MTSINNKEYLKKYLSIGKAPGEKKKKKNKSKCLSKGLKIVDDDILVNISEEIQHDLDGEAEDAPLIVSVIDDRPPSLRIDNDSHAKLWKPIGNSEDMSNSEKSIKLEGGFKLNKSQTQLLPPKSTQRKLTSAKKQDKSQENDFSPPRNKIKNEQRSPSLDNSPPRPRNCSKDILPPRIIKQEILSPSRSEDNYTPRKRDNSISPPRRKRDISPPRKRDNDVSPPRKNKRDRSKDISPHRKRDTDMSPPGKNKRDSEDISPLRQRDNDMSPPRKIKRDRSEDISPPRKRDNDMSPPRRNRRDSSPPRKNKRDRSEDISPPRRRDRERKSRWESESEKMTKTLEGKTAGLQNALDLAQETVEMRQKNDELFRNMSVETSGKNAATVVRNSLRKKKKEVDPEEEERKRIREEQNKEKYDRWGKGLKQVNAQNARMEEVAHEMSKPLARYADDEDLETHLKDQERAGDPMLAYMRKKKRKADVDSGKSVQLRFEGQYAPNRFGIPPGYRWDGVDRSNGYEKKYFEVQNKKKADIEEAYKWSTEDM